MIFRRRKKEEKQMCERKKIPEYATAFQGEASTGGWTISGGGGGVPGRGVDR